LFLLCGKPKAKGIPTRALSIRGVVFQVSGLLMAFFAAVIKIGYPGLVLHANYYPYSWLGSLALAFLISLAFVKLMPLEEENPNHNQNDN